MTSPIADRMLLHISAQPREHDSLLADQADGVIVQAPWRWDRARHIIESSGLTVLQHDGGAPADQQTLWSPDEDWLGRQTDTAIAVSRTAVLGAPTSTSTVAIKAAVASLTAFCDLAILSGRIDVAASLAIDRRWLTTATVRHTLASALNDVGFPVHLMLASPADPLETVQAVAGLVDILTSVPDIAMVRCDHGALGAYAFGAIGGSIGTTGGTRHFILPGERGYGLFDDPTPRVLLRIPLDWWRGSRLGLSNDPLFECACVICGGQHLSRYQNESLLEAADAHSVTAWMTMMQELRDQPAGDARQQAWLDMCQQASEGLDLLDDRSELLHPPSKQLKAWLRFAGVKVW